MESNKDEALKCLTIARKAMELGDYAKAVRFTEKSIRLFPTGQGEQLLSIVQKKNAEPRKPTAASTSSTTTPKPHRAPEPVQERKYTTEQVRAVKTILACGKDYYKILSVDKSATDAQIKKAYRKQALQFHPDKNSAPGADEAFKLVAKAFDILSDSNKRAIHDEGGDADGSRGRSSAASYHQQQYAYNRRSGDDVSPEDLFNMFFGGGMRNSFGPNMRAQQQQQRYRQQQQQQRYRQQYTRQQTRNGDDDLAGNLSQMMPIILISILAIFALLFSFEGEPLYTFRPAPPNTNMRTTRANNINYYVNPKVFDTTVKNNMHKFSRTERQIETDWLGELRLNCQSEQRHRANLLAQADGVLFGIVGRNEKAYKKAENMKMANCDELRRLAPKIRG
ncbi:hypothetical protein BDF21DRAFT_452476 [Thamnidium elegans]|uniref:J domain-containing protein n=1 Tax=Thamnidium elegans TaxID=101142 RepID=A0A8H7SPF8_9FUNG|nr:hypothetical protein INT48_001426 [Thamnidium elegans]KAI8079260.1 hypothetical protein BDF21DRAFT_452476 [Thamnidium elegans]